MIEDKIRKEYLNTYYGKAEDLSTWFNAGLMNRKVAEFLLQKYNSSHKRLLLEAKELMKSDRTKRRINPHHLVLHRYILMFFGLSLECYFKGLLIKTKKIEPLTPDKKSLSKDCLKHLGEKMYKDLFGLPTKTDAETLERLRRAILAGKYPIERDMKENMRAYTAYLDTDIKTAKRMIEKAKQKWQELHFATEK